MTLDDLFIVDVSWSHLRRERARLLAELTRRFDAASPAAIPAAVRAVWLLDAVEELIVLLATPSRLAAQARLLGETWPDPRTAPSFAVEGRAWLAAASRCLPAWSDETDAAWRQAWFLLSDVLAVEALSPFSDDLEPDERPFSTRGRSGEDVGSTFMTLQASTSKGQLA
jgi:hypothetical protein